MFFIISKIVWVLIAPSNLIAICLILGVILYFIHKTISEFFIGFSFLLLILFGVLPTGYNMVVWLEKQYSIPLFTDNIEGFIVLGGSFETDLSAVHKTPQLNSSADRLYQAVKLINMYPDSKLLFTGKYGGLNQKKVKTLAADEAMTFFDDIGLKNVNLILEGRSRNTYENALFSKELVNPKSDQKWVLITSAYHMKRAVSVFHKLDWSVIPYPTDFKTEKEFNFFYFDPFILRNLRRSEIAIREIIGIIAYKFTGKL
jgi:uncharacterized SAM-binding protein YcdF (DUF218 family)